MSPNPNKNILQECADCGSSSNLNSYNFTFKSKLI